MTETTLTQDDIAAVKRCQDGYERIRQELAKVIVGQDQVGEDRAGQEAVLPLMRVHDLLDNLGAGNIAGHQVRGELDPFEGQMQGLGDRTDHQRLGQARHAFQQCVAAREHRDQHLLDHFVLADEINRTPPKTQAAMLEAMQERHVSAGGKTHHLPAPFFVLATQNPLEQEGTYPLPEAQLDRFLLYIKVDYPSGLEEWEIARRVTSVSQGKIEACMSGQEIIELQKLVTRVPVSDQVLGYAWALVRASRPGTKEAPEFVNKWVNWGAGPRGVLTLVSCAKARAILHGRYHATIDDIQKLAKPALRHRIAGNYAAQANNVGSERMIEMLMEAVPADRHYERPAA